MALASYAISGIASMLLGATYVVRSEFMPYHAQAVGTEWVSLPSGTRALFGALMDVVGAAWMIVGSILLLLIVLPFRAGEAWSRWTIPLVIVALYGSILLVTLQVQSLTGAQTPWMMNAVAVAIGLTGLLLDRPWKHR